MQTIIITGWAGFIGSNFLSKYVPLFPGIVFVNIDALTPAGNIEKIDISVRNAPNYIFRQVDILDRESLEGIYKEMKPTDVIHFAAESHVDHSIRNPKLFSEVNLLGTQNLLDLHREFWLNRFHYMSTDEVYGDIPGNGFFTESTPLRPSNPYSASKASADMLVQAYGRTFWLNYTISRCSNNYGPHQNSTSFLPLFISRIIQNQKVPLYGDGSNIRDWLYVEDSCEAIWRIFTEAKNSSIYNVGGNNEHTNLEITKYILQYFHKDESLIEFVKDRSGHDKRYAIDATKIQEDLGWKANTDFQIWLKKIIHWYGSYL